ncbi:MAG: hypothetical protein QT03_C0001G1052 [archaeon GW2011_AR10]|uniref:Helix-turn-helix domain-containing protein n=1 Tax=Candidatus Iainarchaeum sp. TaxID=3101447 RepID=A0A7J4IRE7_9ARCH|nr:MAG: hypothetical protein QT03_C0001G1052 [archaeon GW2011_AR10]HIH08081.1 hypothetical protein [Candidatus Diapherotrites archaeon]
MASRKLSRSTLPQRVKRFGNLGLEASYRSFKEKRPRALTSFERFEKAAKLLAETDLTSRKISKELRMNSSLVADIAAHTRARTKAEIEQIRRDNAGPKLERVGLNSVVEETRNLLRGTRLSQAQIAAKVGIDRHTVSGIRNEYRDRGRGKATKLRNLAISSSNAKTSAETVLGLLKEKTKINGKLDYSYSIKQIAELTNSMEKRVSGLCKMYSKRTDEDNQRVGRREAAKAISRKKRSPALNTVLELLDKTLLGSREIHRRMRDFDTKTGYERSGKSYVGLLMAAKKLARVTYLPRNTKDRARLAKEAFLRKAFQFQSGNGNSTMKDVIARGNVGFPTQLPLSVYAEWLFEGNGKGQFDLFEVRDFLGLKNTPQVNQDLLRIKRGVAAKRNS